MKLRKVIFWTHLLAGVVGGLVIFIMSFTGVILMYEPQIAEYSEWNQRWVTPPAPEAKRLALDDLVARVRDANPEGRPAAITVKSDPAASVIVNLGRENTVFVNPYTGELLGGLSATHHFMHEIVYWHRWLAMEDEGRATGKAITGACNLAFFWLAVTGVYLWWPQELEVARFENQLAIQLAFDRQSTRLELAQRDRLLVFERARGSYVDRRRHVLSLGQRFALHPHGKRTAAKGSRPTDRPNALVEARVALKEERPPSRRPVLRPC